MFRMNKYSYSVTFQVHFERSIVTIKLTLSICMYAWNNLRISEQIFLKHVAHK
jgi:hypothetical protein